MINLQSDRAKDNGNDAEANVIEFIHDTLHMGYQQMVSSPEPNPNVTRGIANEWNQHEVTARQLDILHDTRIDCPLEPSVRLISRVGGIAARVESHGRVLVPAGSFAHRIRRGKLLLNSLVDGRQEDDLAVRGLGHRLHGLEVADLHGRRGRQNIGSLAHELGGLDFSARRNDLALSDTLGLRGHGERVLELVAKDDVLDQDRLDLDTPGGGDVLDYLANRLGDFLAALNDVLQDARTDHVPQGGLRTFYQRLAHIRDTEGRLVRRDHRVVDDRAQVNGDVVLGHAHLSRHLDDLDLDVHGHQALTQWVDFDEARIHGAFETIPR